MISIIDIIIYLITLNLVVCEVGLFLNIIRLAIIINLILVQMLLLLN